MIPPSIPRQTITIVRAPLVDDGHGNLDRDWSAATETPAPGWAVQPSAGGATALTAEVTEHRDAVRDLRSAWGPPNADVLATDRVKLDDGKTYEVVGDPHAWQSASGRLDHTELLLERWEG